jgi:hypothetical protein
LFIIMKNKLYFVIDNFLLLGHLSPLPSEAEVAVPPDAPDLLGQGRNQGWLEAMRALQPHRRAV